MNGKDSEFIAVMWRMVAAAMGGVMTIVEPTLPYILICTLMILGDCYTAWQLSRRVKRAHPGMAGKNAGKFSSRSAGRVMTTLIESYMLIVMAYLIGRYITDGLPVDLAKVAAGAICFWQMWSILENESSCNGAKWARIAQKIFIDKTERHLDVNLSDLKHFKEEEEVNHE